MMKLKNEADLLAAHGGELLRRRLSQRLPVKDDLAFVGCVERAKNVQQRALATA
jgi:hypothetical protein